MLADNMEPIVIQMKCHYKQVWPHMSRIYLEPVENVRVGDARILTDFKPVLETELILDSQPADSINIIVDDIVTVTVTRCTQR